MPGSLGHWPLDHLNIGDHLELCRFTWTWVSGSLEHGTLWRHEDHSHLQGLTLRGQGGDMGAWGAVAHVQASQKPTHKRAKRPCSSEPPPYTVHGEKKREDHVGGSNIYIHPTSIFLQSTSMIEQKKVASLHLKFVILGGAGNKRSGVWLNSSAKAWI